MSKKETTKKQPRTIKVKTVLITSLVISLAVAIGTLGNWMRTQAYEAGYNTGYNKGVKVQSQTDRTVIERVKEIKALMQSLK